VTGVSGVTGTPPGRAGRRSRLDLPGAAAVAVGLAIVVVAVAPFLLWWHRLPSPMAVHWDAAGTPDGAMSKGAAAASSGRSAGAAGVGSFVAASVLTGRNLLHLLLNLSLSRRECSHRRCARKK